VVSHIQACGICATRSFGESRWTTRLVATIHPTQPQTCRYFENRGEGSFMEGVFRHVTDDAASRLSGGSRPAARSGGRRRDH
jgi:hypothetical protein